MKTLYSLLILAACLCIVSNSHAQMRQVFLDAIDENNEVQKFSFYSPNEGYVAFSKWIGFTNDSGRTFTRKYISYGNVDFNGYSVNLTFGFGIKGVKAFNQDTLIVYGDYGLVPAILYSIDKGNTFKLVVHSRVDPFSFKTGITDMVFPQNNNVGYAIDADRILRTTNKGLSWALVKLDVDRYFDFLEAVDNNNVYAFSAHPESSKLYKTVNGGNTWTDVAVPAGKIGYAHFLTADKGWLIMDNDNTSYLVYYTSNGGVTWTQKNDAIASPFYSEKVHFVNDSTGYALAGLFGVYKTTDSGKVWQPLPRDNNYTYNYYSHNDLQVNANQLWAGGGHGFIEMSTNGGGTPLPKAYFKVDTNGVAATGIVSLRNYSRSIYQYKWFKNDTLISTSYNSSFTHNIYQFHDTISLVVSDGGHTDTMVQYVNYPSIWITGFTPTSAVRGNTVTITGFGFTGVYAVTFGGVPATSFTVVSNTQINAVVDVGASGSVQVFKINESASLPGFTHKGNPHIDLPVTILDSILCKSEPLTIAIQNTEPDVNYWLTAPGLGGVVGSVQGNGGTVNLVTVPLSEGGAYRLKAGRIGSNDNFPFSNYINIKVEHTRARFVADQVNITPGEPVSFAGQAGEAKVYNWTFYEDASISTATGVNIPAVTYSSSGQKTLQLISISENGCRDTVTANAVFVYQPPAPDATCVINPLDSAGTTGIGLGKIIPGPGDVIYALGGTPGGGKLYSRFGIAKPFDMNQQSFFAKYTTDGILKWIHQFKGGGSITAVQTDAEGNIYLAGTCSTRDWFYFNYGDSIRFYHEPADTTLFGERTPGFIMKLDPNGRFLWYTLMYDHTIPNTGYPYVQPYVTAIAIRGNHIVMEGIFNAKLSYARNGTLQQLYDFTNSTFIGDNQNNFVIRIKSDGSLLWSAHMMNTATNSYALTDVDIDKNGNSYLVGYYEASIKMFDAARVQRASFQGTTGYFRSYMVKYDSLGNVSWYNNFVSTNPYAEAMLNDVAADADGNTYVTGAATSSFTITHSNGTVSTHNLTGFDLVKFDAAGLVKWSVGSQNIGGGSSYNLYLKNNEIYASGTLQNLRGDLNSCTLTSTDGNNRAVIIGQAECFVARYDTSGKFKRVYTSGYDNAGRDLMPNSMYINSKGQFLLGVNSSFHVDGNPKRLFHVALAPTHSGNGGIFLKMNPDFCQGILTADAGPDKSGCENDTVSIGSKVSGDYYSWTSNPAGFISNLSNPLPKPKVNTTYYLKVTNEEGASAYDTVLVTIKPAPIANAGPDTSICSFRAVTIGTPAIPGNTYKWIVAPGPFPAGQPQAQISVSPLSKTIYWLKVTGPNGCPAYDTVVVDVIPTPTPVANIATPATTVCKGAPVTFTASLQNIGTVQSYQWLLSGSFVGTNSNTYTVDSLKNGDRVSVKVTHTTVCVLTPNLNSNTITMSITDKVIPVITIAGNNTVMEGEFSTLTANISNGGTNYQLRWQDSTNTHSWTDLPKGTLPANMYDYHPSKTGDKIRCVLTVSNLCVDNNVIPSAGLSFTVNKITGINPVPAAQYGLRYYPNPAHDLLIIDSLRLLDQWNQLEITSVDGKKTFLRMNLNNNSRMEVPVAALSPGIHIAILRNRKGLAVYLKFIKL